MLLNDFFKITHVEGHDKYIVNIVLNPNHKIYDGHFPGNPIVPGVCLTQMVKETVEHLTNKKLSIVTGDNIKFTAVLNPNINPDITMSVSLKTNANGLLQADCTVSGGDTSFFSFKGTMREN